MTGSFQRNRISEKHRSRTAGLLAPALIIGWLSLGNPMAAQEDLPKAEVILDKYVQVTGGKAAYEKIRSGMFTGTIEFVGRGLKGSLTSYRAEPNRTYTVIELEGIGRIEEGTNEQVAWERSVLQGPRLKEGEEKAFALLMATFNAELRWRELYKKAESAGLETIGDQVCYKVIVTPAEGKPQTRYFDKKTNLLVKGSSILKNPMGEIPVETVLSDYKDVEGILSPHKISQKVLGQELLIVLESVKHNVDIPKDRFDPPEDVKALIEKSKAGAKQAESDKKEKEGIKEKPKPQGSL